MSLVILALMAWFVMMVFAIVPKGLTLNDMVFLYFVIGILTITIFTILDVNLHWVPITRKIEESFALYLCRFIVIPLLVLMSASVLLSHLKMIWKGVLVGIILLVLCLSDRVYLSLHLIRFEKWNELYSSLMYAVFFALIWGITRWFVGLDRGGSKKLERN